MASFRAAVAILQRLPTPNTGILYDLACDRAFLAGAAASPSSGISAADGDAEADGQWLPYAGPSPPATVTSPTCRPTPTSTCFAPHEDFRLMMMDLTMPTDPFAAALDGNDSGTVPAVGCSRNGEVVAPQRGHAVAH